MGARRTPKKARLYLPAARRCQRVAFNIFLCFFLRMRLRRFLIREPMSTGTLVGQVVRRHVGPDGWGLIGGWWALSLVSLILPVPCLDRRRHLR